MRPADAIRGRLSDHLDGAHIALAVTGSVAAVEAVKVARELIRHGAHVRAFATGSALRLVGEDALAWATGAPVVTDLTGEVEHLGPSDGRYDVILVAPATANTLAKMAHGIADDAITTLVQSHLGTTPVVASPAMHTTMERNPVLQEVLERLENHGVDLVPPVIDEDEAKLPTPQVLAEHVIRAHGPQPLAGRRVLVVNGSTIEPIDRMRVITNKSTGRMGFAVARAAFRLGADVTLWVGHHHGDSPDHIPTERFTTVRDILALVDDAAGHDLVLLPAAISDFTTKEASGKLPSGEAQTLELVPTPKVVQALRKVVEGRLIGWKAEGDLSEAELIERARAWMSKNGVDAVVANRLEDVDVDDIRACLIEAEGETWKEGTKKEVATWLMNHLAQ